MKNINKKKIVYNFIFILLVFFLVNSTGVEATTGDTIASGKTGTCTYTITELENGNYCLTVSGGSSTNNSYTGGYYYLTTEITVAPWYVYRDKIEKIVIENGVNSINRGTFAYCSNVKEVDFSNCTTLNRIYQYAFSYCESLEKIDLSDTKITLIDAGVFNNCESLKTVILPTSITEIGSYAFGYCSSLEEINLSELTNLTTISNNAFFYCTSLENIELPSSIVTVEDYAFCNSSLVSIDLSNCTSLEELGESAFYSFLDDTNKEKSISLPKDTCMYCYEGAIYSSYINSSLVKSYKGDYYIDTDGIAWGVEDGVAYLSYIPSDIETYTVPSYITVNGTDYTVIGVDNLALAYSSDLVDISFEDSSNIISINPYAFAYCKTLKSINGYTTITNIIASLENATIEETAVKATEISTVYNLHVNIDLNDYSYDMEEYIKTLIEVDNLTQITLQLYCNGELLEEKAISVEAIKNGDTEYVFENLSIENEYYVDISHDNSRWGANILYSYSGSNIPTYAWINIGTKYAYTVSLDLNKAVEDVEVQLIDEEGNIVDTGKLTKENNYTYVFYTKYLNNRSNARKYISENYTVALVENADYNFYGEIAYDENISYDNDCAYTEDTDYGSKSSYYKYSYNPGAVISLYEYSNVIVHHYIEGTETSVPSNNGGTVEDETYTGIVGDEYKTQVSGNVSSNYEYVSATGNTTGTYTEGTTEVTYYYRLKDAEVTSTLTKTGSPETITKEGQSVTYTINYKATIDSYTGDATLSIVDSLLYNVEEGYTSIVKLNGSEVTVTPEYDSKKQTLSYKIPIEGINASSGENIEINVEITLTVVYKDVNYGLDSITNEVYASIYFKDTEQTEETEPVEEITYIDITHNITTKVDGEGGTISGENEDPYEKVAYGDSNTKEIVIVPDDKYEIESITINGEEVEFTPDEDGSYTLPTITDITEDKEVVATFVMEATSSVIVKYVDKDTGEEIEESVYLEGYVGDEYSIEAKEIDGYQLVEIPENVIGKYTKDTIEVIYYYSPIVVEEDVDTGDINIAVQLIVLTLSIAILKKRFLKEY